MWATRKGINPYVVARSIARKGTKANPFFSTAIDKKKNEVDNEFDRALDNILNEI